MRAYTPISGDRDLGVLDFLIKVYWAGVNPLYPQGGKMTQHLAAMKVRSLAWRLLPCDPQACVCACVCVGVCECESERQSERESVRERVCV